MQFKVIRQHQGDKNYQPGDLREAEEADVQHLIGTCLEKMAAKPKNKAAKPLKNKAK